ncbi:hypothetical protein GGX14DRAFT_562391 [Mycena pura]|uniref:MAPEG family protein n=1 Tax=Mycena pura TaxID=153505 RepID=A0AAD6VPS4_9AGAR|nr:hypothetical protein GGX14DRAFT_562391 [Mycena pura]
MSSPISPVISLAPVAAAAMAVVGLLSWQAITVGTHRTRAGVTYPHVYADKQEMAGARAAVLFNCAQRAHQNTLENVPSVCLMTGILATRHPTLAAAALGLWVVSRIAYTLGYLTGNPDNARLRCFPSLPALTPVTSRSGTTASHACSSSPASCCYSWARPTRRIKCFERV